MLGLAKAGGGLVAVAFLAIMLFKCRTNKLLGKEEEKDNGNISNRKRANFNPFKNSIFSRTSPSDSTSTSSSTTTSSSSTTTTSTNIPNKPKSKEEQLIEEREDAKKNWIDETNYIQKLIQSTIS